MLRCGFHRNFRLINRGFVENYLLFMVSLDLSNVENAGVYDSMAFGGVPQEAGPVTCKENSTTQPAATI